MKVDQEFCQNEPEKYKLCMPHLCVHKEDPCYSHAYTASSVTHHDAQPLALIIGLTIGSLFLCILIVALIVFQCRRRKSQGDYHKTGFQLYSSAITLNECDADPESPHHKTKSKSKQLLPHMPKHGYKLIPMLSNLPKVHKAFMSPAKNEDSRRNSCSSLTSNPNSVGRRSSDLRRGSNGGSPIVMSPAAAAARQQYRLVPDADMPSRIYKNPNMMNNSPKTTSSKNKKLAANNKNVQMSMLARIT